MVRLTHESMPFYSSTARRHSADCTQSILFGGSVDDRHLVLNSFVIKPVCVVIFLFYRRRNASNDLPQGLH